MHWPSATRDLRLSGSEHTRPAATRPQVVSRRSRRSRPGFTMLELIVVIGIIVLLVGMMFVGMSYVGRGGRESATRSMLSNARSMLAEYETSAQVARIYMAAGIDPTVALPAPGYVTLDGPDRHGQAVHQTHEAMTELMAVPTNREILQQMPPERLMPDADDDDHAPVLLDGWNNPIIIVPPAGMTNVIVGGQTRTIVAPNNRPFFASAGQSGSFRNGDDNIYSFEE